MGGNAAASIVPAEVPAAPQDRVAPARGGACALRAEAPIIGNIVCDGPWEILCSITGELRGTELTIAAGATVVGSVVARDVTVRGRVTGTIRAATVRLRGAAAVDGDIFHQTLLVEEDAVFDGTSRPLSG
jgi:cytoskeletal protein CcmA (bactofilin family)